MGEKKEGNKDKKEAKERKINYYPVIFNGNIIGRNFSLSS
jgi:hypothetical protein